MDESTSTAGYEAAASGRNGVRRTWHLAAFRARPILQEEVVNEVLDEVVASVEPRFAEVEGVFNARGAMSTRAVAREGDPKAAA
jgi:NADPH-dependent 7-cyano-7-deazaguanine reductase QueF